MPKYTPYQSHPKPKITRKMLDKHNANVEKIWQVFSPDTLRSICQMPETDFAQAYGLGMTEVDQNAPSDWYAYRDNGSDILAVAHLDTVSGADARTCNFVNTADGPVVYSRALDDRLGAYIILDLLPRLGIEFDILLTVGEETGQSTALFFDPPKGKDYNWLIEFDRGGTDVVTYQYEDDHTSNLVVASGAKMGDGIFSDISYMDHLEVKAFNWGVGYQDYHSARSHAFLNDTVDMVARFMEFHTVNADVYLPHEKAARDTWGYGSKGRAVTVYDDPYDNTEAEYAAWLSELDRGKVEM